MRSRNRWNGTRKMPRPILILGSQNTTAGIRHWRRPRIGMRCGCGRSSGRPIAIWASCCMMRANWRSR